MDNFICGWCRCFSSGVLFYKLIWFCIKKSFYPKGFDRDGERYLILDYSNSDIRDIEENFVKESDSSFENEVSKILKEIDIDNKYLPSFTDEYYSNRDDKL